MFNKMVKFYNNHFKSHTQNDFSLANTVDYFIFTMYQN